jgi:hypothetical protein
MTRFTPTNLQNVVDNRNLDLHLAGSTKRFEMQGRNGYQAVDEYSVDASGNRIGSGVDCNVGCGTSREVYQYVESRYYQLVNEVLRSKLSNA